MISSICLLICKTDHALAGPLQEKFAFIVDSKLCGENGRLKFSQYNSTRGLEETVL